MNKIIKIKGLIFEGCDGTGKSTIKHLFYKKTDSKWFVIDRGPGSLIVYGRHHNRKANYVRYKELDRLLTKNDFVLIYFTATNVDITHRLIANHDNDIFSSEIDDIKEKYEEYLKFTTMKTIILNTSIKSPEMTVDELISKLKQIGPNYYE